MHDVIPSQPNGTAVIENEQKRRYPGLRVRHEGDAVVVHIPVHFRRRNGRSMILTDGVHPAASTPQREVNQTLIDAIAKAYRWQKQIESGEFAGVGDLAQSVGVDRTYAGRLLRLTSLAPYIIEAILRGDEPDGISLEKLRKNLPVQWDEQGGMHHRPGK